jgi:branched-chain amino acid transport system permease protein
LAFSAPEDPTRERREGASVDAGLILMQFFNGIVLGAIYVLVAVGLTVVFGMLNVINFAHGAIYTLGAYLAFALGGCIGTWAGSFWVSVFVAPLAVASIGALIEVCLIRRMYDAVHEYQILLTFGVALVIQELVILIWGPIGKSVPMPPQLVGVVDLGQFTFPLYRLFLVGFVSLVCLTAWLFIEKTSYGAIIRAGTDNRDMVNCLGIDIYRTFTIVFSFGVGLAGLAGVLALPERGAQPLMGDTILTLCFVVVVIGGLGSFVGAILAGFIVGVVESMMILFWPPGTMIAIFSAMALVILIRPKGLLGFR